ncbi:MAG: PKD domain-containing protein, partial [Bacteroidales bacterium]|nr:PKD domain-containing protein [Bacteroidales bacterium]
SFSANSQITRVLFIGNSLTGSNNLPNQFNLLAQSTGKLIYVEDATAGGATLQNHLNNSSTISKIQQGNWDYVVLQEQSQLPSWENDRSTMFYPYAKSLDSIIKIYNPCGETVFFLTYAHRNGDLGILQNGGTDTYWAMQQRLRDGYMEIADSLNSVVCPVGWAFRECRTQYPNIELYQPDYNHPTDTGTYLAACVFYSTIFQDSSIGASYIGNMPLNKAILLQNVATQIVMDSIILWNIGQNTNNAPIANYIYYDTLLTVHFIDSSINAQTYQWDFGDGNVSILANPIHTYSAAGNYIVRLTVESNCGINTFIDTINVIASANPPICNFTYIANNLNIDFSDSSQYANTYYWDFGDGDTSLIKNPIHNYLISGIYLVKHVVSNNFGSDSIIKQVNVSSQLPIAYFNHTYLTSAYTIIFNDSSQYANTYLWDFGDGDTSSQTNPTHTFPGNNIYNVKLIASNTWGSDSIIKTIIVNYNTTDHNSDQSIFTIFPNPTNHEINIASSLINYRFELRSLDNKVLKQTIESQNAIIDISMYPKGLYIIVIKTNNTVLSKKIIKL